MDFLKGLEKAKKLGLTKEEFKTVWEMEVSDRGIAQPEELNPTGLENEDLISSSNSGACSELENLLQQFIQRLDQERAEMRQYMQTLCDRFQEQQQKLQAEVQRSLDLTKAEFAKQFEIINQHVTNSVDTQANTLTLLFTKEMDLIKEELGRKLDGLTSVQETEQFGITDSYPETDDISNKSILPQHHYYESDNVGMPPQLQQQQHNYQHEGFHQQDYEHTQQNMSVHEQQYHHLPTQQQRKMEVYQNETYANVAAASKEVNANRQFEYCTENGSEDSNHIDEISGAEMLSDSSVPGTGFYAEIISQNMKRRDMSPSVSVSSGFSSRGKSLGDQQNARNNRVICLSDGGTRFTIRNSQDFSTSKRHYRSHFFYTPSKACKVRVHLWFNEKNELNVELLLSRGEWADRFKQSVKIWGSGSLYNFGSKKFTPLWTYGPSLCLMARLKDEITLKAEVCLNTSRGNSKNPTYITMDVKKYISNDCLHFKWEFNAIENKLPTTNNS